jgi:hypothetical protein
MQNSFAEKLRNIHLLLSYHSVMALLKDEIYFQKFKIYMFQHELVIVTSNKCAKQ